MLSTVEIPPDEAEQIRERTRRLELPGLVDVHTHFMPPRVLDKVWSFFDRVGEVGAREPWPIAYRAPQADRVERLRSFGLRAFTALNYPHKPDMAAWLNDWTRDFSAATDGCVGSATFYAEPSASAYLDQALTSGARVVKVHVQVGAFDPLDDVLDPVWGLLAEAAVPVVLHAGSGPHPGRFTGPGRVATLLQRHPSLVLVVAHMGLPEYADFLALAEGHDGVHLDTTMAFTPYVEAMHPFPPDLRPRLAALGHKVLWGSDFPNIPYPYLSGLDAVLDLAADAGFGEAWLRAVLHDNGARLLRLDEA